MEHSRQTGRSLHKMKLIKGRIIVLFAWLGCLAFAGLYYRQYQIQMLEKNNCLSANQPLPATATNGASADVVFAAEVASLQRIVDELPETTIDHSLLLKYGYTLLFTRGPALHIAADMPVKDAEILFHQYIRTPSIICPKKVRIGRARDGGWDACITGPLNITTPCLVYSVGIGPDSTFDNTIADAYRCLDMAFDPSIGKQDHKPKELFWFFNTGMGRNNTVNAKNWRIRTFGSMLKEYSHDNKTIDILKIDTEYAEWESFEAMFREGSLRRVKQLMFEFHTNELGNRCSTSSKDFAYYWQILRGLDKLGFKMWHYLPNPSGVYWSKHTETYFPCCGNVYYVNINHIV